MNIDSPVPNPTWYQNIKGMFTQKDINCMNDQGLDLSNYNDVKNNADGPGGIYDMVHSKRMPMGATKWSDDKIQTFKNWMNNKYPEGTPPAMAETSESAEE